MAFANKHFTPEFMFFLDNDTEMDKKILINLIEAIKKWPSAGIACPKAYQKFPSSILMSMGLHVNFSKALIYDIGCGEEDEGQYDTVRSVDACGSFGVLVKQEVLNKLGEWDNQFYPYGWEDVDLCLRATKLGHETLCVPQAIIYHAGGQVGRGTVVSYEEYKIKHFFLLLKKHGTRFQYVSCLFWIPLRGFLRVLSNLRKGDYQLVTAQLRGIMKFLVK